VASPPSRCATCSPSASCAAPSPGAGRQPAATRLQGQRAAAPGAVRTLGTAVPVCGLLLTGLEALLYSDVPARQLTLLILIGCGSALLSGFFTTVGAAQSVADPVRAVRRALQQVEQGELEVSVPVYDTSELGQLQAGFNTMVAGLRERDRIRDLFGRQVGHDVASAAAAASEVRLGGEQRQVAVLFVDVVGSTALASSDRPTRWWGCSTSSSASSSGWWSPAAGGSTSSRATPRSPSSVRPTTSTTTPAGTLGGPRAGRPAGRRGA